MLGGTTPRKAERRRNREKRGMAGQSREWRNTGRTEEGREKRNEGDTEERGEWRDYAKCSGTEEKQRG
jgi:hypothetical protein